MFDIFTKDIYEREMNISLNTLKRFREVWIGKNKGFSSDELFRFANEEFYFYRYMVSQAENEAQRMMVRVFKRLFDCDEYKMKFIESYSFRTPYNFIVEDNTGKRIGYRFEEFCDSEDENVATYLEEYNLDSFSILLLRKETSKVKESFNLSNPKITVCLMVEFFEKYFSLDEYKNFRDKLDVYLMESNDAMGYKSIPFLSTMNLAILKSIEKEKLDDWKFQNTRYQILNRNNKELFENVMAYVEKYNVPSPLFGIMEKTFKTNGINALLGTNDFAKSFITSEWLYEIFTRKKHFDYTVIISGYLKSIEQLLYNIALLHLGESGMLISVEDINKAKKDDINIIPKNKGKRIVKRIKFCETNKPYMKIELGALQFFFKENTGIYIDDSLKEAIDYMLTCYRIECRNGYFHKHNLGNWDIVEKIRNNTILLYFMLLGGSKIDIAQWEKMGLTEKDDFDEICNSITEFRNNKRSIEFILVMEDNKEIKVIYDKNRNCIKYDEYGNKYYDCLVFITVDDFSEQTYIELDKGIKDNQWLIVERSNVPKKIFGLSRKGEREILK